MPTRDGAPNRSNTLVSVLLICSIPHPWKPLDNHPPVPGDYFRPPHPRRMRGMEKTALNSARQPTSQLHGPLSAFAQGLDFGAGGISGAPAATVVGGELGAAVGAGGSALLGGLPVQASQIGTERHGRELPAGHFLGPQGRNGAHA